jgi:hypothetical protein
VLFLIPRKFCYTVYMYLAYTLALIAFVYFYTLKYDEVPENRKWVLAFIPLLIIVGVISLI